MGLADGIFQMAQSVPSPQPSADAGDVRRSLTGLVPVVLGNLMGTPAKPPEAQQIAAAAQPLPPAPNINTMIQPPQQQAPPMNGQDMANAIAQQPPNSMPTLSPQNPTLGDRFKTFGSQFAMNLGDYLVQRGGGADPRFAQNAASNRVAQLNAQSEDDYRKAQVQIAKRAQYSKEQNVDVTLPNGMTIQVPKSQAAALYGRIVGAKVSEDNAVRSDNTKKLLGGYSPEGKPLPLEQLSIPSQDKVALSHTQQELQQARIDAANADPNTPAGRVALHKLNIAMMNARSTATRAGAAMEQAGIAKDKYMADFYGVGADGKPLVGISTDENGQPIGVSVAKTNQAPATMIQNAEFAKSGLSRLDDAEQAIGRLEKRGVLGSVPANKLEDWIFGKGYVDPNLPADVRADIGRARAALSYTSSAAMRAHTGRTSKEIYDDFKNTNTLAQGSDALHGALSETRQMLQDYAGAASNRNIQQLRQGKVGSSNPAKPSPSSGGPKRFIYKDGQLVPQ